MRGPRAAAAPAPPALCPTGSRAAEPRLSGCSSNGFVPAEAGSKAGSDLDGFLLIMGNEHAASFSWLGKLMFFKVSVFRSKFASTGGLTGEKKKKKNKRRASRRAPALPRQVHQSTLCKEKSPALLLTSLARLMHSRGSRYGRGYRRTGCAQPAPEPLHQQTPKRSSVRGAAPSQGQ